MHSHGSREFLALLQVMPLVCILSVLLSIGVYLTVPAAVSSRAGTECSLDSSTVILLFQNLYNTLPPSRQYTPILLCSLLPWISLGMFEFKYRCWFSKFQNLDLWRPMNYILLYSSLRFVSLYPNYIVFALKPRWDLLFKPSPLYS
jgi:hypothetical protein